MLLKTRTLAVPWTNVAEQLELGFCMWVLLSQGPGGPRLSPFPCRFNDMPVKAFSTPQTNSDITDTSIYAVAAAQFQFLASG